MCHPWYRLRKSFPCLTHGNFPYFKSTSVRPCRSIYAPINVSPHHPPLGIIWGNSGDLTYPNVKFPTVGQTEYVKYTYIYTCIYTYVKYTVYTCVKCPIVGQKFCVNSPSKAPLRPEGGVVGEYIDRCITCTWLDRATSSAAFSNPCTLTDCFAMKRYDE